MPCFGFAHRLARDLGWDCCASLGVAGLAFGWLRFPFISEGDAVLARPGLRLERCGRAALSGGVFSSSFAFNLDDATQALACRVTCAGPAPSHAEVAVTVCVTHWRASVVDDAATRAHAASLASSPTPSAREEALAAIRRGSAMRVDEAQKTVRFLRELENQDKRNGGGGGVCAVLAGDLNTVSGTPELAVLAGAGWRVADAEAGRQQFRYDVTRRKDGDTRRRLTARTMKMTRIAPRCQGHRRRGSGGRSRRRRTGGADGADRLGVVHVGPRQSERAGPSPGRTRGCAVRGRRGTVRRVLEAAVEVGPCLCAQPDRARPRRLPPAGLRQIARAFKPCRDDGRAQRRRWRRCPGRWQ